MSYTLLLADDSVTIQRVIELTFAEEDVRVVAVSDGSEAIARLDQKAPPDIVLADVGMPGQNGYEVARYIKATPRLAHIPVVLLTGAFEPIDQARVVEVGCDGVLQKPFEPQLVIARVKELLAKTRDTQVQPKAPPVAEERPGPKAAPPSHASGDMDSYFDRLDAALSTLSGASQPRLSRLAEPVGPAAPDWLTASPEYPEASLPAPAPVQQDEMEGSGVAVQTPVFPPLADAFAALLAAEQSGQSPVASATWPTPRPIALASAETAEIVEEVTRRVLDQLSDRVMRETVTEMVSASAERLIREEIERIKREIGELDNRGIG